MARLSDSGPKDKDGYMGLQEADVALTPAAVAKPYQVKSPLLRECMAEFIGTMVLIMFGDGVVAQVVLSEGAKGDYININLCWGLVRAPSNDEQSVNVAVFVVDALAVVGIVASFNLANDTQIPGRDTV
ncbi:hypothetical protein PF006_g4906 [Phytophthora fragariae]|uniref:Aquaporin n=2 Tax=Phytophthora TaxID=4783 RepID=A0A6A3NHL9_9STRA|nr:hypothetical protein PF003_g7745 [Phytophthora fragariae]KAE9044977.1 hypothetical protein PR002_g2484 [Phytophthora rubi]KAE9150740.1 hypothetical protein PF006_g4906 [Phytophthora fragariae]